MSERLGIDDLAILLIENYMQANDDYNVECEHLMITSIVGVERARERENAINILYNHLVELVTLDGVYGENESRVKMRLHSDKTPYAALFLLAPPVIVVKQVVEAYRFQKCHPQIFSA